MGTRNLKIWKARYLNDTTANHSAIRLLSSLSIVLAIAVIGLCLQVISLYLSDVPNHSKRENKKYFQKWCIVCSLCSLGINRVGFYDE